MPAALNINNYDSHLLVTAIDQSNLIDHVPAMVYKAYLRPQGIILHKDRPTFTLPQLRFGRHNRYVKQITGSYDREGRNNGVLLMGEKGSGKSLMAEELGNWMIKQDLPVIMVSEPMGAEELSIVIKAIGPCMVYFDEFGKTYNEEHRRERLLTLFSDTSFSGVMFVITGNEGSEFSNYLYHRPQRFLYSIRYDAGVDEETLDDILKTMRVKEELHQVLHEYRRVSQKYLNFDSLMCVIRQSADCATAQELVDRCEILNVPGLPEKSWHIKSIGRTDHETTNPNLGHRITFSRHGDRSGTVYILEAIDPHNMIGAQETVRESIDVSLPENYDDLVVEYKGNVYMRIVLSFGYDQGQARTNFITIAGHQIIEQSNMAPPRGEGYQRPARPFRTTL